MVEPGDFGDLAVRTGFAVPLVGLEIGLDAVAFWGSGFLSASIGLLAGRADLEAEAVPTVLTVALVEVVFVTPKLFFSFFSLLEARVSFWLALAAAVEAEGGAEAAASACADPAGTLLTGRAEGEAETEVEEAEAEPGRLAAEPGLLPVKEPGQGGEDV